MDTEVAYLMGIRERTRLNREADDVQVLRLITENPRITVKAIAENLGWIRTTGVAAGQPNSMRVYKAIRRLRKKGQVRW
jgi:Winged helix-turn-helix DNA-binding